MSVVSPAPAVAASDPPDPRERPRTVLALCAAMLVLAAGIAWLVVRGALQTLDVSVLMAAQRLRVPPLELVLGGLNAAGFPPLVDVVYGGIALLVFLIGLRRQAVTAVFTGVSSAGLNHLAKALVPRDRPPEALLDHPVRHIANSSFPAGHVLNLTAFLGVLCVLVVAPMRRSVWRDALATLMAALLLAMGLGRVESGEHWPSDVVAGYLLGIAALCIGLLFDRWLAARLRRRAAARASS